MKNSLKLAAAGLVITQALLTSHAEADKQRLGDPLNRACSAYELPEKPESLSAATREVHQGVMHPFVWFLAVDLVTATDPKGEYRRVQSGFARAGFTPSRLSQYGLGAAIVRLMGRQRSSDDAHPRLRSLEKSWSNVGDARSFARPRRHAPK